MKSEFTNTSEVLTSRAVCYHCGDKCKEELITVGDKNFCCTGCKLVYELLNENNLCTYYNLNQHPGNQLPGTHDKKFDYLDHKEISEELISFRNNGQAHVTFYLPGMHCSSCIWLLENLHRLQPAIIQSVVNFRQKEITVVFNEEAIKLSAIAGLLSNIGYAPHITLNDTEKNKTVQPDKSRIIKIAVAGFCFGNIMMLSFPEYFGLEDVWGQGYLRELFRYLNLLLALPVLIYPASGFFISAWKSIRQRHLNIDAPIALAIAVTFLRSVYEIASGTGGGYLDSMTGIVFFMLIGRYVQDRTYHRLSFDRDYRSYFPLAVRVLEHDTEKSKPVSRLQPGDIIVIRNQEIIPADAHLLDPATHIDYSFVSGESSPVTRHAGDLIYAGGRQLEGMIRLKVNRSVSQSYLTQLWNNNAEQDKPQNTGSYTDLINRYFTIAVLITAASACFYWLYFDPAKALDALSAVLIVACPCGLLLTASFTNGSVIRLMGKEQCYLKNAGAIESMAGIDTIVFDKTGTITHGAAVSFKGILPEDELAGAVSLAAQSSHIFSRKIVAQYQHIKQLPVSGFKEIAGQGIKGTVNDCFIMMGSERFITGKHTGEAAQSRVYLSVNGTVKGFFSIGSSYREGLQDTLQELRKHYELHMLSGDNAAEYNRLQPLFMPGALHFNQLPDDKYRYILQLQQQGKRVMMIGDGLNDAHAFRQSNFGLAISDDTNNFSPACDAILGGSSFGKIPALLRFAKQSRSVITGCFAFSLIYNIAGLFFAVQGSLSPVIAAILMPASSISIVLISTLVSGWYAGKIRTSEGTDIHQAGF